MAAVYREFLPTIPLRRRVACYWTMRGDAGGRGHRVLPDGASDLLFVFGSAPSAIVVGVMTQSLVTEPAGMLDLLGVRFHPGEAFALLDVAADELRDRTELFSDLWREGDLHDALAARTSTAERIRLLDSVLLERSLRGRPADARVRAAVALLHSSNGTLAVSAVASAVNLSERQLERAFHLRVGVGPKSLARTLRLQSLVARFDPLTRPAFADLAADLGYTDQAHLVTDVRRLAGVTPLELWRERAMSDSSNTAQERSG